MLNPNNDRLNYGDILAPPNNYQLDFAIGTSYSLDLDALVGAAIALGLAEETDTNLVNNPIFLLEALRTTGDNVALFCEGGQIRLPSKVSPLYILLENMVFPVKTKKEIQQDRYASFHPKFWLLRFKNEENQILYRIIALSRNLTFDRSWDVSFVIDGEKFEGVTDKNNPIIDFLNYLLEFSTVPLKSNKIKEICEELKHIRFDLKSNTFYDFDFIPCGLSGYNIQNYSFYNDSINGLLIMSPFLSKDVIEKFNQLKNDNSKAILITRFNSLERLKNANCSNFEVYTLIDQIVDGESVISEESQDVFKQDIHAKIFVMEYEDFTDLYLGSLNASHNAIYSNIEFMVRLRANKNKLNINKFSEDIFNGAKGGPNSPFQLIGIESIQNESSGENKALDLIIKRINRLNPKAEVFLKDEFFNIKISFEDLKIDLEEKFKDLEINFRPLLSKKESKLSNTITFEKLNKIQLSEFFIISVGDVENDDANKIERVIKIPTFGMPDDREKDVVSEVINDKSAFIRYVAFLLGDNYILATLGSEGGDFNGQNGLKQSSTIKFPELYERMLKASCSAPEKFQELEFLIKTLSGDDIIPEGFEELYNTFMKVVDYND